MILLYRSCIHRIPDAPPAGASSPPAGSKAAHPQLAAAALPRPPPAAQGTRAAQLPATALTLRALRGGATDRGSVGSQGGLPRDLPLDQPQRSQATARALP